ncbi:hypothetical protein BN2476_640104 [Paraburkholderia piptadeniae]|uniref:Uncharacterized protein n=1 Tax=Paraburkholderia piptadeniae TaxID=1701573 RepID=A0A1N7SMG2_9BURK|nr:hypothetical protein BN2476_640104 [Paraburkholderia piptadeniae]
MRIVSTAQCRLCAGCGPIPDTEIDMATASRAHASTGEPKARTVFRVVSGNFLEMYDFMV